jgi:glycosyltransferase involved in cell wall biosynthesis
MRVALVHYWLVAMRGGERVLEALLELFPEADIFTHVYAPEAVSPAIRRRRVFTSLIQQLPFAVRQYKKYLPLMPLALEQFDLRGYDLVISSESGPAKGVLTGTHTPHICYCHTPMRYLWDFYQDYLEEAGPLLRPVWRWFSHRLRAWDALAAMRVDFFAANSRNVASRIAKHYRKPSAVIHPPVDVRAFAPSDGLYPEADDYYLYVGQLSAYKRPDLAVRACSLGKRRLVVIGDGPEKKALARMAGPTVTFLGRQDTPSVIRHMRRCRALLFPGEEDFGIVMAEAQAAGRPVIAFARGGALESVVHGQSGILFPNQDLSSLSRAMAELENGEYSFEPAALSQSAERFSREAFLGRFSQFARQCLEAYAKDGPPAGTRAAPEPASEPASAKEAI